MSTINLLIDGKPQGFEIRRLPPNKQVGAKMAVRDTASDMVLIVGANGAIYSDQVRQNRSWSWQHGISNRVASALVTAGVITKAQADEHAAAVKFRRDIEHAYWDLKSLHDQAEKCGVTLTGGDEYGRLCKLAALYVED